MLTRIFTALVGLPLLVGVIALGDFRLFAAFLVLLTLIGLVEYFQMAFPDHRGLRVVGVAGGLVVALAMIVQPVSVPFPLVLALTFMVLCAIFLFMPGDLQQRYYHLGVTVIGVLYLGYLFPHFAILYRQGKEWVLWVLAVVFAGDTLAYFVGMAVGRRRLYPEISPGKTVAGALASVCGSIVVGAFGGHWLFAAPPAQVAAFALVLNILGQVGDLFESWIKRTFVSKDSGHIIPGHGGLMDRIDSLIFPGVVSSYCLRLLNQ